MAVKTKKTKKAKTAKKAKKSAARATAKRAHKAKKSAAKKTAKKPIAKTSPAKKVVKKHKQGRRKSAKTSAKKAVKKRVAKTPTTAKTAWKISPEISQSVAEIDTWKKDDLTIEYLTVYRSGWIIVDQLPDLTGYNPDEGVNIFEEFEFEEHQLYDGSEQTSLFPNELSAEERNRLLALSEAELEDEGWTLESVTRFKGPLVVERL